MTSEEALAKIARPIEPYPKTGEPIYYLRGLSAAQKFDMRDHGKAHPELKFYQLIFVNGVVDEAGNRVMTNGDAPAVADGLGGIVEDVVIRVMELSGLDKETDDPKASSPAATT